jgi:hypothetical protein
MAGIKDYSTTQANNTSLNGINTAEGMLPSNLNNAIRALMKNTREWYNDSVNGLSMVMVMQLLQQLMQVQLHSQLLVLM